MTIDPPSAIVPHDTAASAPPEIPTTAGIKATDSVIAFRQAVLDKLTYMVGKDPGHARDHDWLVATALVARDHIVDRWVEATRRTYRDGRKRVYYFSLEFLIGRLLFDALGNLGITETARAALRGLEVDLDRLRALEPDAALGNGGLGRLAACFMESMATLGVPAHGYGIRYDHGIFRQALRDGWQLELPEDWLSSGNPWEFERPEVSYTIGFGGTVESIEGDDGTTRYRWDPAESVNAVAFDTPIAGWRGRHVNTLRLWSARATDPLRLDDFNRGDHVGALADRVRLEAVSRVLYPSDDTAAGHELRLRQEFFFASASLQDLLRRHKAQHGELVTLADHVAIQLNDTHPAIAVPELMRLLVDEHGMPWELAWNTTTSVFNYTNHTLLPEALETWPVSLLENLLPRHMQIIYLINALHLDVQRNAGHDDAAFLSSISMIEENHSRRVRMGHLAFLGSRRVNGVSALHTALMRQTVFRDLNAIHPERIVNKTNGISFRRWLYQANPGLTRLIVDAIGPKVEDDATQLDSLVTLADDASFRERFAAVRRVNKVALARVVAERLGFGLDPDALFDVHIKRIHEYKRQLLNILETIALYNAMRAQSQRAWVPRVKIFAGKAAAGYHQAKLIIKLASDVARVINRDPVVRGRLKVVFVPNYNVSVAEAIIPASDLSEQISTAGMEASGTGNMKLALNGALTIGTLDGANIEIQQHVGGENMFIFGLLAEEVAARRRDGIDATAIIGSSPALAEVLNALASGMFSPDDKSRYRGLVEALTHHDYFMVAADFEAYREAQRAVGALWQDQNAWWRIAVLNTARMSWFSADRAILDYARSQAWDERPPRSLRSLRAAGRALRRRMLPDATIDAIVEGRHADPFAVLGVHEVDGRIVVRAFVPGAATVEVVTRDGARLASLSRRHDAGFFEGKIPRRTAYRLRAANHRDAWVVDDAYAYGPVLGPLDDWLIGEGTYAKLYDGLGAHAIEHEGVEGVHFAVWAPNAQRVSVVGDFNTWDGRRHAMRKRFGTGVWEIFVPALAEGTLYKYEIVGAGGALLPLKADPVGFGAELRPSTASVVRDTTRFAWADAEWMTARAVRDPRRAPMSIYEVHLGSWRRGDGNRWLTYDELSDTLVPYAAEMGFTHLELMPVNEHPLDESWGYQPIGLFAPTSRFGEPAAFARFVDRCHRAGIGVILDWVPAHFPVDPHGLAQFDGTALYEHADPRQGFHPDWSTAIFNFGRREVANYLIASALFWLDRYHVDGLRVDAVASMLYLDYSRKGGEWLPNPHGGNENLEAIAFLRRLNETVYARHPGAITIAEESTAWPAVSQPTFAGGLGFGFKWNMGWMHDTLEYLGEDPVHRRWHHAKMTFGLMYAFAENFVLPLSHDEVVHGKKSLLGRIRGDAWQQFATLRAYFALMWAHPGKKLLFMGQEFAQGREWNFDTGLDWPSLGIARHSGVQGVVRDCNRAYQAEPALHARDCEAEGFRWIVVDDADNSVLAWLRFAGNGARPVAAIANFTPVPRPGYRIGLPAPGRWREILNTDGAAYGGSNCGNGGSVDAVAGPSHGLPFAAAVMLPPLGTLWLVHEGGA